MPDMRDSGYHWSSESDQSRAAQDERKAPWGAQEPSTTPGQAPTIPGGGPSPWSPEGWSSEPQTWQAPDDPSWGHGQTARGPAWGAPAGPYQDGDGYRQQPDGYRHQPDSYLQEHAAPYGHAQSGPYGQGQSAPYGQGQSSAYGEHAPQAKGPYAPPSHDQSFASAGPDATRDRMAQPTYAGSGWGRAQTDSLTAPANAGQRKPKHMFAASLVVTALVAGGCGAAIALALDGSNNNPGTNNASAASTPPSTANNAGPRGSNSTSPGLRNGGNSGNMSVAAIANKVEPAVVDIYASGPQGQDEGTGMIISTGGLVLTNNHVIAGSTQLQAQINGAGRKFAVTVVGADPTDDVALLQLHGRNSFDTVQIGNSDNVTVGTQVVAIGNALGLPGPETVTNGIISTTSRSISVSDPSTGSTENLKGVFQTSAPINPGNSGGPLLNDYAQVIGINTAAASSSAGNAAASNVGFAIPINKAMSIVRQIEAGKASSTIYLGQRAIIGIDVTTVACAEGQAEGCMGLGANPFSPFGYTPYQAPVNSGAVVQQIQAGTPAANAGLGVGDVIVSVAGHQINSINDLTHFLSGKKVGQSVRLGWVDTSGAHHSAKIKLIAGPNV